MYGPFGAIERAGCWGGNFQASHASTAEAESINSSVFERLPLQTKKRRRHSARPVVVQTRLTLCFVAMLRSIIWINERAESQLRAWRWGRPVQTFSLFGVLVAQTLFATDVNAADQCVRFDVPSLAEATVVNASENWSGDLMEIRLAIPVTTEIEAADRDHVNEFRYDIQWQHADYPIIDFGPRTQTTSTIEGAIGVETRKDRSATFGLALTGGDLGVVGGSAKAEAGSIDEKKIHYEEIPQHDVLVASGTVDRGTGAFFRFHRSRRETLEGSRELSVSFRVPSDWTAGLLQVKCHARGERKFASLWPEPIEIISSFTLPVYLSSSPEARKRVVEYVRAERGLQQLMAQRRSIDQAAKPSGLESVFRGLLGLSENKPDNRMHIEPQSRVVRYRVPLPAPDPTGRYQHAREELLRLSR